MNDPKIIETLDSAIREANGEGWDFVDLLIEDAQEILEALRRCEPMVLTLKEGAVEAMMTCKSLNPVARLEAVNHIMPIPAAYVEDEVGGESGMTVVKRKPVPIYSEECPECKSVIEYKASEIAWCHIKCPVCGTLMGAVAINPVRYECTEPKDEKEEDGDA